MWGNNFWLGAERSCFNLNSPPEISLIRSANRKMFLNMTAIASEVPVEYRMFYASHTSTIQFDADLFNKSVLHLGICLPQSCSALEANVMAESVFENKFQGDVLYGDVRYLGTKTLTIRDNLLAEPLVMALM